jgi:hypothetical protein
MPRTTRGLAATLAATLALTLAGAARATPDGGGAVLVLENAARGRTVAVALAPGETFSVTSQHSMYDAPVTETFAVRADGRIVLRTVSSPSAAVREYFGITAAGERHAVERVMAEIVFRIATGEPQRLRAGGVERSFLELGAHGDRVVMRAAVRQGSAPGPARAVEATP